MYPHIAAVCMFELVVLLLPGDMLEYITYELIPASPAVSCMSGSSNLDSFRDGRYVAVLLVMLTATFNGNPIATIISGYSPTNASEETELVAFYDEVKLN